MILQIHMTDMEIALVSGQDRTKRNLATLYGVDPNEVRKELGDEEQPSAETTGEAIEYIEARLEEIEGQEDGLEKSQVVDLLNDILCFLEGDWD